MLRQLTTSRFRRDAKLRISEIQYRSGIWRLNSNNRYLIVIGAQRAGTTSLYRWLSSQPNISPSIRKEVRYFTDFSDRPLNWYRSNFWFWRRGLRVDVTPDYMFVKGVAEALSRSIPDAMILMLLRNPLKRAFSHWQHMCDLGFESLSFADALAAEPARNPIGRPTVSELCRDTTRGSLRYSYLSRSLYAPQVEEWRAHFDEPQLLIADSDSVYEDGDSFLQWLGRMCDTPSIGSVSTGNSNHSRSHNHGREGDDGSGVTPEARRQLATDRAALADQLKEHEPTYGQFGWINQ